MHSTALELPLFSNEPGKTLMPAPTADGTALQRALESDEDFSATNCTIRFQLHAAQAQEHSTLSMPSILMELAVVEC